MSQPPARPPLEPGSSRLRVQVHREWRRAGHAGGNKSSLLSPGTADSQVTGETEGVTEMLNTAELVTVSAAGVFLWILRSQ